MIIALLNQKGGVGKTTLAVHLASEIARLHLNVMLVDADPQGSALDWSEARLRAGRPRTFGVIGIPRETLHREIAAIAKAVDHIIIDGPPRVTALTRSAMMAADLVLIPVQPSPIDLAACTEIVSLVDEATTVKPLLGAAFVINRKIVGTVIGRQISVALNPFKLHVMEAEIGQRVAFAESAINGMLVRELDRDGRANQEIQALSFELIRRYLRL